MNKKLDNYFAAQDFDLDVPRFGHMERFEKRLKQPAKKSISYKWMSIAASIILLIGIWTGSNIANSSLALADVSPQMQEAERKLKRLRNLEIHQLSELYQMHWRNWIN
jgi:hypothetical protein